MKTKKVLKIWLPIILVLGATALLIFTFAVIGPITTLNKIYTVEINKDANLLTKWRQMIAVHNDDNLGFLYRGTPSVNDANNIYYRQTYGSNQEILLHTIGGDFNIILNASYKDGIIGFVYAEYEGENIGQVNFIMLKLALYDLNKKKLTIVDLEDYINNLGAPVTKATGIFLPDNSCIVLAEIYETSGSAANKHGYHGLFRLYRIVNGNLIDTLGINELNGYYVKGRLIDAGDEVGFFIKNSSIDDPPHLILYRIGSELNIIGIQNIDISEHYPYSFSLSNPVYNNIMDVYQLILSPTDKTSTVHCLAVYKTGNYQFLEKQLNEAFNLAVPLDMVYLSYDPKAKEYLLLFQDGYDLDCVWFKSADKKLKVVKLSAPMYGVTDISLSPKYYRYGLHAWAGDSESFYTVGKIYLYKPEKIPVKKFPMRKIPRITN